jgi:hypothetical protein
VHDDASAQVCLPKVLAQPSGYALGGQAGEATIRQMAAGA